MATREYNFTVGPETSEQPSVGTPSSDDDLLTRGYADERYLQGKLSDATIADIKAIGTSDRRNGDLIVDVTTYGLYVFDSGSSATGDDDLVLTPDSGSGRWLKIGRQTPGELADLTTDVTGVLPVANGGTGASTATPAFDNLSPGQNKGDLLVHDGSNNTNLPVGADGLSLITDSSTSTGLKWGSSASGSGEVNYISNFDAENASTTGYNTYDDGASATPVDGTGGTASNIVFSNSTATILRGNRSFRLTKSNSADCQGMGFSQDFSIPDWEPPRKSKIEITYDASDSDYTAGDLAVYIYDVTNSVLITPVDTSIPNNSDIFQTSFNSNGGGDYRLIVHVTSTTTNNWSVWFDRIIVGPGMTSQGAAVGEGQTVDIDGNDFTNDTGLTIDGRVSYQRVGDSLYVTFSAETSGNGSDSGDLTFDLAGAIGESITFLSGNYGSGYFSFYNSTIGDRLPFTARFIADGTGSLTFTQEEGNNALARAGTDFGNTVNNDRDQIQITAILPVAEWAGKGIVPMLAEDNLSEWQSFTPDFGSTNWGDSATISGYFRRVGDSMEIDVDVNSAGSGFSVAAPLRLTIPNNLTIDSNKTADATTGSPYGMAVCYDASAGRYGGIVIGGTTSALQITMTDGTNDNWGTSQPATWVVGDGFSLSAKVPIQEWAGSQNSLVGYSEATSDNLGLVKKSTWEQKLLSSNLTASDSDISDLKFTGLTVGRQYRVTFQVRATLDTTGDCRYRFRILHDSSVILLSGFQFQDNVSGDRISDHGSIIFTATTTTLISEFDENTGQSTIIGTNSSEGTWVLLEELKDYEAV